jgi:rubrerythrin
MAKLEGTKTHHNLKEAFAGESQANRRYLYFAKAADIEGYPEVSGLFRDTAEGETGHAHGHLDYLKAVGDPTTDMAYQDVEQMLASAVAGETHEYTDMYPGMARTARRGLPGDRGLVRNPGQGRALARRQVPEGPRRVLMPSAGRAVARPPSAPVSSQRGEGREW